MRLNHLDGAVREAAIGALGQLEAAVKSKHVAAGVGLLKKSDTKAHVRQAALTALAALDQNQSLSTEHLVMVVAMLTDSAHNVRMAALNLLKLSPNPNPKPNPNPNPSPNFNLNLPLPLTL